MAQFRQLPPEMVEAIATHLQPEDLARFFASSRRLYDFNQLPKFREAIEKDRARIFALQTEAAKEKDTLDRKARNAIKPDYAIDDDDERIDPRDVLMSIKPDLALLLGPNFPQYQGYTIANYDLLSDWFYVYLHLNRRFLDMDLDHYQVDDVLAKLSGKLDWQPGEIRRTNYLGSLLKRNMEELPPNLVIPRRIIDHINYLSSYFHNLHEKLYITAHTLIYNVKAAQRQGLQDPMHFARVELEAYKKLQEMNQVGKLQNPPAY